MGILDSVGDFLGGGDNLGSILGIAGTLGTTLLGLDQQQQQQENADAQLALTREDQAFRQQLAKDQFLLSLLKFQQGSGGGGGGGGNSALQRLQLEIGARNALAEQGSTDTALKLQALDNLVSSFGGAVR